MLEHKQDIKQSYKDIEANLEKVCNELLHSTNHYFLWLDLRAESRIELNNPIERMIFVLRLVKLLENQQPKTVIACPGFLAVPPRLYDAITELNAAKQVFQNKMVSLRKELLKIKEATIDNQFGNPSHERPKIIDDFLRDIGLEKLHLKHVYRRLPTLEFTPSQLGWTWAHTQSIKTITKDQAIAILQKRNYEGRFNDYINQLKSLDENERLSIRQKLAPHLRINVVQPDGTRLMLKGTMPVVFPIGKSLPIIRPAKEPKLVKRASRKDKKIGDVPFIPEIRLYITKNETIHESVEIENLEV